ncbi:MAG: hypothetical protein L3J63_07165 [Geopsychrobacter sp.]|nr:hypothetical protein [Geopsychrobacter sp.]
MANKQALRVVLPLKQLPAFFLLLQQGVWLHAQIGCSVSSLLTEQLGIAEDYIIERVTTLFLDGKPIDNLETSYVNDGSTLALSSAMPGLVGTTMRRGSHLAAMRGDITCQTQQHMESGTGRIRIKLFNLVMAELGAIVLARGICLSNTKIENLLTEQDNGFEQDFVAIILNEQQLKFTDLLTHLRTTASGDRFELKVEFKD